MSLFAKVMVSVWLSLCRQEVYHMQKELLKERTRCRALEEELENPMNVHRWRKLEVQRWIKMHAKNTRFSTQ